MKRIISIILILACMTIFCAAAQASDVRPKAPDLEKVDMENGTFAAKITDTTHLDEGSFTLGLYEACRYYASSIEQMAPGDVVYINRLPYTVKEVVVHSDKSEYEVIPEGDFDGYIVFNVRPDRFYSVTVNDWQPCIQVAETEVTFPLPETFVIRAIEGDEEITAGGEGFFESLSSSKYWKFSNQYNTTVRFEDGKLVELTVRDYPLGPEATEGTPLYEVCGCDREALRDAVITCMLTDCEAGPKEKELSVAEQESIRRLAMNGKMTDKVNDMDVTGETTIYTFTAPDGTGLMSLEFYHGLLMRKDGMYNYTDE